MLFRGGGLPKWIRPRIYRISAREGLESWEGWMLFSLSLGQGVGRSAALGGRRKQFDHRQGDAR